MEVDVLEDDFDMNENTQRTKIGPLKNQRSSSTSPDQRTKELFSPEDAINNDFFYDDELVLKESVCSEFSVDLNRPLFTPRSSIHEEIMEEANEEVNSFHLDIAACNEHRYYLSFAQNVQKLETSDPPYLRSSTADSMQNWAGKSYANEVASEATWPEIMKASDCSGNNNTRPKEEKVFTTWKTIGKQQEEATRSKSLGDLNVKKLKPTLNKTKSVQESDNPAQRQSTETLVEAFQKVRYQFPDVDLAQIANTAWSMTPSSCDLQWPNEKKDFAVQTTTRRAFSSYELPDLNFLYEAREPPDLSFADGEQLPPFPDLDLLDEILQKNTIEQKSPKKTDIKPKSKIPTPKNTKSKIPMRTSPKEPPKKAATVSSSSSGIGSSVRNVNSDTSTSDSDICAGKTKKLLSPKRRAQNNMKKMENIGLSPNKEKVEKREGKRKARPASDPCIGEKLEEDLKRGRNPSDEDDRNSKKSVSFSENISYLSPQRRRGSCPSKTDSQAEEYLQVTIESSVTAEEEPEYTEKRKLFLRVIDSANVIKRHLAGARDSELQARLANTAITPLVGHLLIEHLCPAICDLVQDGLRTKAPSLFGYLNNNIWKFVEDSANTGPTTRVLYEAIQDLNSLSFLTTPLMKFNAFIFALLNHKALDFWLSHVISEEKFLSRHHLPHSCLRLASGPQLGPLSLDMTDSLVPLCHIQWQLQYSFEYDQMERSEQRRLADSVLQKHMSRAHAHEHAQRALRSEHARIVMMDVTKSKSMEQSHSDSEMRQSSSYLKRAGELIYKLLPPKSGKDQKIDLQDESLVEKVQEVLEEQKPEAVKTKKRHSWSSLAPALVQFFDKLIIDTSKQPGDSLQNRMSSSRSETDLRGNFSERMYRSRSEHI